MRKNKFFKRLYITPVILLVFLCFNQLAEAGNKDGPIYWTNYCGQYVIMTMKAYSCTLGSYGKYKVADGYSCVYSTNGPQYSTTFESIKCTKTIPATYTTQSISATSLRGVYNAASSNTVTAWRKSTWNDPSPYIYTHNTPTGPISITPDSDLDIFTTKQPFTLGNTWLLSSTGGEVSLAGEKIEHLFYRLAIDDIELSRHGRNFSSRSEIINYLKTSDFLSKLGLSEEEATNSLKTIVGDLEANAESPYYYLTVLDQASIDNVSKLNINPAPEKLIRSYFAVYPTPVPVKTAGDFIFPALQTIGSEYAIKETGELFISPETFVKFK